MRTKETIYAKEHYSAEFQNTLVNFAKEGSKVAQDELIMSNMKFIRGVAIKYPKSDAYSTEELVNEGVAGMVKAIYRFNPEMGANFLTYSVWWVKQSISAYIRDKSRTIRLPAHRQADREISMVQMSTPILMNGEAVGTIDELIEQSTYESADDELDAKRVKNLVDNLIKSLPKKEAVMIRGLFGIDDSTQSYGEMADSLGVKPSALKFVRVKAVKRLKKLLDNSNMSEDLLQYLR